MKIFYLSAILLSCCLAKAAGPGHGSSPSSTTAIPPASHQESRPTSHREPGPDTTLKTKAIADLDTHYDEYKKIALQIWDYAEVGYKEVKSSALLQKTLTEAGFKVQAGVADIPTAFVATYGSGSPVIGTGDPAFGTGNFIGAIGTGTSASDLFGR